MCSLKDERRNLEYLWQADKEVWPRHAPVLFPFVGRLRNYQYTYQNKYFNIEQHGFARDLAFEASQISAQEAGFELRSSEYTISRYPFNFLLNIKYALSGNTLCMEFSIENKGNEAMPFSFGAHPAFNILNPGEAILLFENDFMPKSLTLKDNFISQDIRQVTDESGKIVINPHSFDEDAMVFRHLKSKWIQLISGPYVVKAHINTWPYLGIWSKPNASFICIEPWQGLADSVDFKGDIFKKEGILTLRPHEKLNKVFRIELGDSQPS